MGGVPSAALDLARQYLNAGAAAPGAPQAVPSVGMQPVLTGAPNINRPPTRSIDQIKPLQIDDIDGQKHLDSMITAAMRGAPGDTADMIGRKVAKLTEFRQKASALGPLTKQQADQMFFQWYDSIAGEPNEFATFSPEAQQALNDAYMTPPQRRVAGIADVDHQEAATLAGYALATLLTGKGNLGDVLRDVPMLKDRAQMKMDAGFQNELAAYEANQKMALAKFGRINEVDDFNAKQRGFEAHDLRMADKQHMDNLDEMAKAAQVQGDKDRAASYGAFQKAVLSGDPNQVMMTALAHYKAYQEDLTDVAGLAQKSAKTLNTEADTDLKKANTAKSKEVTQGLKFKNAVDLATLEEQINIIQNKSEFGDQQVKDIKERVRQAPLLFREKIATMAAQRENLRARSLAIAKQADASMIRANKAGTGSGGDEFKNLGKYVTSLNTSIDNKSRLHDSLAKEVSDLKFEIERAGRLEDPAYDVATAKKTLAEKQAKLDKVTKELEREMRTLDDANDRLARLGGFELGGDGYPFDPTTGSFNAGGG